MFANNFEGQNNIRCGLVSKGKHPIPLLSVDVRATVIHAVAQVELTQSYVNKEEQPIEAIYYFPVDPEGSVTNFQAELDGRVIKNYILLTKQGSVKPREEALKFYEQAIDSGKTSFLGEETKIDIFKLRVGFLKPGAHVKVVIEYITEVKNEPGTNNIRFYIPTTIAPRYVSSTETDKKAIEIRNMQISMSSPAPLSIKVIVYIHGAIKAISSPTHFVRKTEIISDDDKCQKVVVELLGETTDMNRDFVLIIEPDEKHVPRMYSETNGNDNSTAVMVHLLPSFKLDELRTELIFVMDRSDSMQGLSIKLAKEALLLFLHSMPADCYFNVVGFGSTYMSVFPSSVKYDDENLKKAKSHARALDANMGGTEILTPLEVIFNQPGIDGYLRQIFILTDGEVYNTDAIFGIVHKNAHKARVFALGIGDGSSHGLITGIAKAGCGTAAFVTYNESMDKKVLDQLKNALQPSLTEVHLEWEGLSPIQDPIMNKTKTLLGYNKPIDTDDALPSDNSPRVKQSPEKIRPVFDGSQLLVFGLFSNDCPKSVLITAQSPDGPLTVRVERSPSTYLDGNEGLILHRLAVIKLIRELETKEDSDPGNSLKQQIIDIACHNGITSRYTSFVVNDVTDVEESVKENWVMETRYVSNQLAHGYRGYEYGWYPNRALTQADIRLSQTQAQVDEVLDIMGTNVQQVLDRDQLLSNLEDRADCLSSSHHDWSSPSSKSWFPSAFNIKSKIQSIAKNLFDRADHNDASYCRVNSAEAQFNEVEAIIETNVQSDAANASISSPLMQLINLQSYNGSFTLDEELPPILGKSLTDMLAASDKHNLTNQVFATALAISFFVNNLADEKDKWDLIVVKARKWLNATVQPENVDAIIELTSAFLKAQ